MIKVALVFDNIGDTNMLKAFFNSCAQDLKLFLTQHQNELVEISGEELSHNIIQQKLKQITNRFLFVSFSHGKQDSLICSSTPPEYVSTAVNSDLFNNSFFYTWSCLSSHTLGSKLINSHGCSVYWGYREPIWAPRHLAAHDLFISCANRGIQKFISGLNVQQAMEDAIDFYNEKVDELADSDYLLSAKLRGNRDAMDVLGSKTLTVADFNY